MKLNRQSFSITTERLILTPISLDHKEEIFKEFNDEITKLMYPSTPKTIDETISFIETSINGFVEKQEIVVAILHKETREYLGNAGLHRIDSRTPELGIWIKKTAHGNGYGREAVKSLKEWADKNLLYEYLRYPVFVENAASRKIPESLGGVVKSEYDTTNQKGEPHRAVDYYIYKEER
jgi:RimJ/RimL family protein N-acetyltransferase